MYLGSFRYNRLLETLGHTQANASKASSKLVVVVVIRTSSKNCKGGRRWFKVNGKEMYNDVKLACIAIVLLDRFFCFTKLSLPWSSSDVFREFTKPRRRRKKLARSAKIALAAGVFLRRVSVTTLRPPDGG